MTAEFELSAADALASAAACLADCARSIDAAYADLAATQPVALAGADQSVIDAARDGALDALGAFAADLTRTAHAAETPHTPS